MFLFWPQRPKPIYFSIFRKQMKIFVTRIAANVMLSRTNTHHRHVESLGETYEGKKREKKKNAKHTDAAVENGILLVFDRTM